MKRIQTVDALRGFAIIGILLLHSIEHFNFYVYPDAAQQSVEMASMNNNIWNTMFFIFGSKAYGIFALLFGFTFHLQYSKQASKGIDFGSRFLWRMVLLFGFGWINSILFPGEILLIYAILSPSLFFIRKLSNKAVLIFSIIFLLQPLEVYYAVRTYIDSTYIVPVINTANLWNNVVGYIHDGSVINMVKYSYSGAISTFVWSLQTGRILQTIGLFALGLYLGRINIFEHTKQNLQKFMLILIPSLIMFSLVLVVHYSLESEQGPFIYRARVLTEVWKNLFQILSMVSLFVILSYTKIFKIITKPLNSYGRMSLSNYIMQSLAGGLLFYPYGLGLAYKLNIFYSLLLGLVLVMLFIVLCNIWFKIFKQGPLEKLWHTLTWLNIPSLNKSLKPAFIHIQKEEKPRKLSINKWFFLIILLSISFISYSQTYKIDAIPYQMSFSNQYDSFKINSPNELQFSSPPQSDLFRSADGNYITNKSPRLLFTPDSNFVLSAKISCSFDAKWDAGDLIIYNDSLHWAKFCFEKDYQNHSRVVSVVCNTIADDCNSMLVDTNYVYYKIAGNLKYHSFTLYYSANGVEWFLIRSFALQKIDTLKVGFCVQSPVGNGASAIFSDIKYSNKQIADWWAGE